MKKIYISCYENSDIKYKNQLIEWNSKRNNTLFDCVNSSENEFYKIKQTQDEIFIDSVKKHILKDASVVVCLVGLDTGKRKIVDWELRAAMYESTLLKKCGIVIIYLPEVYEKYGSQIPRSILPKIIQKNIINRDASILETTWNKLELDINNIEKMLNVGFAYGQMSKYIVDEFIATTNQANIILKK